MPIYDYKCNKCGRKEEIIADIKHYPPACAKCGWFMTKQVPTGTRFILKPGGSCGWSEDGFRSLKGNQ